MNMVACRKCKCGLYNDITVMTCPCGKDLSFAPHELVDTDSLISNRGIIDTSITVYYQKCPYCGALSYTDRENNRVERCFKCEKVRIANTTPMLYVNAEHEGNENTKATVEETAKEEFASRSSQSEPSWDAIIGSLKQIRDDNDTGKLSSESNPSAPVSEPKVYTEKDLTLEAITGGSCKVTFRASETRTPVILGKEKELGSFLKQNIYIGRKHCGLEYNNGKWIVIDHMSTNGTFVNGDSVGEGGRRELADGDRLRLGYENNSIEFLVTIK